VHVREVYSCSDAKSRLTTTDGDTVEWTTTVGDDDTGESGEQRRPAAVAFLSVLLRLFGFVIQNWLSIYYKGYGSRDRR